MTSELPGSAWMDVLDAAGLSIATSDFETPLSTEEMTADFGHGCVAAITLVTEQWTPDVLEAFATAGGKVVSVYGAGFDNVDRQTAERLGICIGTTPDAVTAPTAALAVALTLAAARRLVEASDFLRSGRFVGVQPALLLGREVMNTTVGIVGAGRIGSAYARMMVSAFNTDILYFSPRRNTQLEGFVQDFSKFNSKFGARQVRCSRAPSLDELLSSSDVVSLHVPLSGSTHHLIDRSALRRMKPDAVLINTSRGPVIHEESLIEHCEQNPEFRAGLDVLENEPELDPRMRSLPNVVVLPHIGSATVSGREEMATQSAVNVVAALSAHQWESLREAPGLDIAQALVPSLIGKCIGKPE